MKILRLLPLLGLLIAPALAFAEPMRLPQPVVEKLPNGLEVIWFTSDKLPLLDIALVVRSGTRNAPADRPGVAALLSRCLDRGSRGRSHLGIAGDMDRLGISPLISVENDNFSVGLHGLAIDSGPMLTLLSDLALHPDLPELDVLDQRSRMIENLRHIPEYPEALGNVLLQRQLQRGTPYETNSALRSGDLLRLQPSDVRQWHRKHFQPHNSMLLVIGKADPSSLRPSILELFGKTKTWPGPAESAPAPARTTPASPRKPELSGRSSTFIINPNWPSGPGGAGRLNQTVLKMGFPVPGPLHPDHSALVLLNTVLGEYFSSRLNLLIREKLALTYSIGSSLTFLRDLTVLTISGASATESAPKMLEETVKVLDSFGRGEITDEEIRDAKTFLSGSFPLNHVTLDEVATRWMGARLLGLPENHLETALQKILEVRPEEVRSAARRVFDPRSRGLQTVLVGPARTLKSALRIPVQVVESSDLL